MDVLTAQEDGRAELNDPSLLGRAAELNRPLYTHDDDLELIAKTFDSADLADRVEFLPL